MKISFLLLSFLSINIAVTGQAKQEKLIQQVLKTNIPRRIFHFYMKDKQQTEYSVRYLGRVKVNGTNIYKVVNFQTFSVPVGLATHGHAIIMMYTDKNKYAGCYHVFDQVH
jgi:hypothetical protein